MFAELLEAQDGWEALQLVAQYSETIDLLLTDVVMPGGMSGKGLADKISQNKPHLKVVYMSGYSDEEIVHHGVLNPGVAFLQKPFQFSDLTRKLRQVLDAPPSR